MKTNRKQAKLIIVLFISLLLFACQQQEPPKQKVAASPASETQQEAPSKRLELSSPIQLFELPPQALPLWRGQPKSALVILAENPLLQPLAESLREDAITLAQSGDPQQLLEQGNLKRPRPLILPEQTLRAASAAGQLSAIYWVYPSQVEAAQIDLEQFRTQLKNKGFLNQQEALSLQLEDGIISGTVEETPFYIVHPDRLPQLSRPLLHIDLSFLQKLYKNAVETPLYSLLHDTAVRLHLTGWAPAKISLSASTGNGDVPLAHRFLLYNLRDLLENQDYMMKMPEAWNKRSEVLYGAEVYSIQKQLEIYQSVLALEPDSPASFYDLFQTHFLAGNVDAALLAIDRAAEADPGYGAAYLQLARIAGQEDQLELAETLLAKAARLFPLDPFIRVNQAQLLLDLNKPQQAQTLIAQLLEENWSQVHHPKVPTLLTELQQAAEQLAKQQ